MYIFGVFFEYPEIQAGIETCANFFFILLILISFFYLRLFLSSIGILD